jgi:hypothetical protein
MFYGSLASPSVVVLRASEKDLHALARCPWSRVKHEIVIESRHESAIPIRLVRSIAFPLLDA